MVKTMQKKSLEKRINSVLNQAIKWKDGKWEVKWNALNRLYNSPEKMCEQAYGVLTKNLVERKILSYSKEGNYDLFVMHDLPFGRLNDTEGKKLYFTKSDYADAYKKLVFPLNETHVRVAPAQ